jgi:hypothetical protein
MGKRQLFLEAKPKARGRGQEGLRVYDDDPVVIAVSAAPRYAHP